MKPTTKPPQILELETRLSGKRTFNVSSFYVQVQSLSSNNFGIWQIDDNDLELSVARSFMFKWSYTTNTQTEDLATVQDGEKFLAFYTLLRWFHRDVLRYESEASSLLKASALKTNFILPAFFTGQDSSGDLEYYE